MRTLILALTLIVSAVLPGAPAAATPCPYTSCPISYTAIKAPDEVERGDRARIGVRVGYDGNMTAKGRVTVVVLRAKGGLRWEDSKKYRGERVLFRTPRLDKRGTYVIKARFDAKPGSSSKDSDNRDEFRVVGRR